LGMFILISLVGFLSIILRDQMLTLSNKLLNKGKLFSIIIEYVSIILIIIIGAFMVFKTLL
jgi:ABC-type nickel/cobalt efflux system permease component RcnA